MTREEAFYIIGNIPVPTDDVYLIAEYQEAKTIALDCIQKVINMTEEQAQKKRIQHKRYYEEHKKETLSKMKDRYNRLKEKRICPGCLEKIEEDCKYIKCEKCRELHNKKRRMNYDPDKRREKNEQRKERKKEWDI